MATLVDHIADQFKTSELVIIAESIGLSPTSRWDNKRLVDAIRQKLERDGVPNPPEDEEAAERSEILLEDFLYVAGYSDEKGNRIQESEDKELSLTNFMLKHNIKKKYDCFSFADDEDPSCMRCLLYKYCASARLENLPPCFGALYNPKEAECEACIEARFCQMSKESKEEDSPLPRKAVKNEQ